MDDSNLLLITISLLTGTGLLLALNNQRRRAKRIRRRFQELEGEEQRLFHFLHGLGIAIEDEPTDGALSRTIVEGVLKVVGARWGATYHISPDEGFLVPAYISDSCPPFVRVPDDVLGRSKSDPRALDSHLRLARVGMDEGLIGHGASLVEAIHIEELRNHETLRHHSTDSVDDISIMLSPLKYAGKNLGVLAVARAHSDGFFSRNDFAVFRSVA